MKKWQTEFKQVAMNMYRGAGSTLTLSELFHGLARKYRHEASTLEMRQYFTEQLAIWREFYADKETVAKLMACNH